MRALVIAMVLSLLASGGAFAENYHHMRLEETKTTEEDCREALSEGKILHSFEHYKKKVEKHNNV